MAATNPGMTSLLIVEDEPETLQILATILARKYPDLMVHAAGNGIDGLALSATHAIDLVISDVTMPDMDGLHMAEQIRTSRPGTRFVFLSGNTEHPRLATFMAAGNAWAITKPIMFGQLFDTIDRLRGAAPPA